MVFTRRRRPRPRRRRQYGGNVLNALSALWKGRGRAMRAGRRAAVQGVGYGGPRMMKRRRKRRQQP